MMNNDVMQRSGIREKMMQALKDNDQQAFVDSFNQMLEAIADEVKQQYDEQVEGLKVQVDTQVLSNRGVRQLTTQEKEYYQKFGEAIKSKDPRQALSNLDVVMPETVLNAVFDELQTSHPLLSRISFTYTGAAIKLLMNTNGFQTAAWGKLCDEIIQELTSGFKEVDSGLFKLSAFLPVCKAMLDLGPQWLDSYVRQVMYEAFANGLEEAILTGTGNDEPIGMNRQVGDDVSVSGGVYPEKAKIKVNDLGVDTIGNLLSLIAVDPNGKPRRVRDLILVVSPQDYFQRVMPATTIMTPEGTYRNDVLPYPITVIQSPAIQNGTAILGMAYKYFAAAGSSVQGNIEYSDHYHFLEDERVYLIKGYANGFPMDNNSFLYLDISGLKPLTYKVTVVDEPAPSTDATLSALSLGSLTLSPTFDAETTSYTTTTTNATNTVTATPADAGASIVITNKGTTGGAVEVPNGSAVTWQTGANTLTVTVTAEDGTTTKAYTVTVTKS